MGRRGDTARVVPGVVRSDERMERVMAKTRRKSSSPGKHRQFKSKSLKAVVSHLRARAATTQKVIDALRAGAKPVKVPKVAGKTSMARAKGILSRLNRSIQALEETCPIDLSNLFVLK